MNIAARIKRFLDGHRVCYQFISHSRTQTLSQAASSCQLKAEQVARSVVLQDQRGIVVVVLSLDSKINFFALQKLLRRQLSVATTEFTNKLFFDCEPGSRPPFGEAYGLTTVVDEKLFAQKQIFFEPGTHSALVRLNQEDFHYMMSNAIGGYISVPLNDESAHCHWDRTTVMSNTTDMECILEAAALPKVVTDIIELAKSPINDTKALTQALQLDPVLAHGLGLYAQLKGFNQEGDELGDSLKRVQDFSTVSHIATGCAGTSHFSVTKEGPLGLTSIWTHALYASQACHELASQVKVVDPCTAYLCGLFQNIGFLLYGHLFAPEFRLLNKWVILEPKRPITTLERRLLGLGQAQLSGCSHAQMGAWLLEKWHLPQEVVYATRYHHGEDLGPSPECVVLVRAVNACLNAAGFGDCQEPFDWQLAKDVLDLPQATVAEVVQGIIDHPPAQQII